MVISIVYVTFKDSKEAEKIVSILLKENLIACANFVSVNSMYEWKGKLKKSKEVSAFCKTKPALINKLTAKIKSLHSYEIPAILSWNAEANSEFENWVLKSTIASY